jgi:hypothetical protein
VVVIVVLSVILDAKYVVKDGLAADEAPLFGIDIGSPIFLNLLLSILYGVVIDVIGGP